MKNRILLYLTSVLAFNVIYVNVASAHCPLCTIGAGAAAFGAAWLGLSTFSIGIFLGAAGLAIGLWMGRLLKKKFNLFPGQIYLIGLVSLVTTVAPLKPLFYDNGSVYVSILGDYGTWLNRTYYVDKFIIGSIIGALLLFVSPYLSKALSKTKKGKILPYQGITIAFGLLLVASLSFELFLK